MICKLRQVKHVFESIQINMSYSPVVVRNRIDVDEIQIKNRLISSEGKPHASQLRSICSHFTITLYYRYPKWKPHN